MENRARGSGGSESHPTTMLTGHLEKIKTVLVVKRKLKESKTLQVGRTSPRGGKSDDRRWSKMSCIVLWDTSVLIWCLMHLHSRQVLSSFPPLQLLSKQYWRHSLDPTQLDLLELLEQGSVLMLDQMQAEESAVRRYSTLFCRTTLERNYVLAFLYDLLTIKFHKHIVHSNTIRTHIRRQEESPLSKLLK